MVPTAELEAQLRTRFDVVETSLMAAGRTFSLLHPRSAEDLLDEQEFEIDERLPYWATIWASSHGLVEYLANWPQLAQPAAKQTLLELGCGCGYVAMVAAHRGFDVLATDYYEPACQFTALNAARNDLPNVKTQLINWRDLPASFGKFDVVLAADVLYEQDYCELIAKVIEQTLSPAGVAVIADPGRQRAAKFLEICAAAGLAGKRVAQVPYRQGDQHPTIDIYELRWQEGKQV